MMMWEKRKRYRQFAADTTKLNVLFKKLKQVPFKINHCGI